MSEVEQARDERPLARGAPFGLLAAALFGVSAPIAKVLSPHVGPIMLAALLYLGSGVGLVIYGAFVSSTRGEAKLRRSDLPAMLGVITAGGMLGPILLMWGVRRLSALASSLLLNLEAPLTIAIAVLFFREHLGRKQLVASLAIVAAAAMLGARRGDLAFDWLGAAAIAFACLAWAIDNNLTQRLSLRDPIAVVRLKSLVAGACTLSLAWLFEGRWPTPTVTSLAMLLGVGSYGVSLLFHMRALRLIGAARQAALFSTAPFVGAIASIPIAHERPSMIDLVAGVIMAMGLLVMLKESHAHAHTHEAIEHEHLHVHDEHHQHHHPPGEGDVEPHGHPHRHEPLTHRHPHVSDLHHRHRH